MPPVINRRLALSRIARSASAAGLAGLTAGCAAWAPAARPDGALRLIGYGALPTTPQRLHGVAIGGLSALAYDARGDLWWALSDARGKYGPPRAFTFRLAPFGPEQDLAPRWQTVAFLQAPPALRGRSVDPEGMALRHDPASGRTTLLWTSEGNIAERVPPAIFEATLSGRLLRQLPLPALLTELGTLHRGPRHNRTLEGIAVTPSGAHAWASMEGALRQDTSPAQRQQRDAPRRITRFELASGHADRQIAYVPDAFPVRRWLPAFAQASGISDLLVAAEDELWVLERAFNPVLGFRVRLYAADLRGASNTLRQDTLRPGSYTPARKRLLVDFRHLGLPTVVDNLEGITWGPPLPSGERSLLLVSDNNFLPLELTQFIALAAAPAHALPPPSSLSTPPA